MITYLKLRQIFSNYWSRKNHKEVPPIPLVPKDDPTTLFTGSGMQQLVPFLLGEPHPLGAKLYNIQPCFRSQDIDEVGDNRHTTFFEMMGNWSLGTYFKEEQLEWCWKFFTKELSLPEKKLFVTVFGGTKQIPKDDVSAKIWRKLGLPENHIYYYGADKNWWSRAGTPQEMPAGEPGGVTSEVFYEFSQVQHNSKFCPKCHPNCDCGKFLEIGNSVFMQYKKEKDGSINELPKKNVDFGGGLERILASLNNNSDMFKIDVLLPIIKEVEMLTKKRYQTDERTIKSMRVLADHMRSASMIAAAGVTPSNKDQGYFLRRLLRKMIRFAKQLNVESDISVKLFPVVIKIFGRVYPNLIKKEKEITKIFEDEEEKFRKTIDQAHKEVIKTIESATKNYPQIAFDLFQSIGYPPEMFLEDLKDRNIKVEEKKFYSVYKYIFNKHQEISKKGAEKKFKGGLADVKQQTVKYHTVTHLLHQALFDVLGDDIRQEGSNITSVRLRFDFYSPTKPDETEIKKVVDLINNKIKEKLSVSYKIIQKTKAFKIGAKAFFKEKYPEMVKVYFIGNYSKELCGGPHVKNTSEINHISIYKLEKIGSNIYRIYAK